MPSLLAIVHLSLMPSWSMVGFPFKDKWFLDELFGNWRWLLVLLKFYLFPPQSSPICRSTGVPSCLTTVKTKEFSQSQLCVPCRVIVCTGRKALHPWLRACPGSGGDGEALVSGPGAEPLKSSIAGHHSAAAAAAAVPAPVNTQSSAKGRPQAEASSSASRACTREIL